MVRKSSTGTGSKWSCVAECLKAMAHACGSSLLMTAFRVDKINVEISAPIIYTCLINLLIIAVTYTVALFHHGTKATPLVIFITLMGYSSTYLVYFGVIASFHSAVVKNVGYTAMLLICVSSLGYFPAALFVAEFDIFRADYAILLLTAFSSAFVSKNTVHRIEGLSYIKAVLYTAFIIISEYALIHFYKNTIFCNFLK